MDKHTDRNPSRPPPHHNHTHTHTHIWVSVACIWTWSHPLTLPLFLVNNPWPGAEAAQLFPAWMWGNPQPSLATKPHPSQLRKQSSSGATDNLALAQHANESLFTGYFYPILYLGSLERNDQDKKWDMRVFTGFSAKLDLTLYSKLVMLVLLCAIYKFSCHV